jgi:5-methylcytosine-specific restriction endonuclease McrA
MRQDLRDDPAVIFIATQIDSDEDSVVGKLHRLWCWADKHTTDGTAPAITPSWVDRYVGKSGFAAAMVDAGWLSFSDSGITFPDFSKHNGQSAKSRAEATTRQRLSRKNRDDGVTGEPRTVLPRPFTRHVTERDGYKCVYCGTQSTPERESSSRRLLSIDHITPESRGGTASVDNLVTCCKPCNNEKNDRTPEEWGVLPTFLQSGVVYENGRVSHKFCDTSVTREEKRREEKSIVSVETISPATASRVKFFPPTVTEVVAFAREEQLCVDGHEFVSFYTSKDWMVGKNRMKDWRAAARGWHSRHMKDQQNARSEHLSANQRREQTTANAFNELLAQAGRLPFSPGSD